MRKYNELAELESCFNKADDRELLFVLRGKDIASPATIRFWCAERVRLGKNTPDDLQIKIALIDAEAMEMERAG